MIIQYIIQILNLMIIQYIGLIINLVLDQVWSLSNINNPIIDKRVKQK